MTVVPLVISLLFVGVAGHDSNERLGRIGAVTVVTFVALLVFAAVVALLLASPLMADMKLSAAAVANLRAAAGAEAAKTTAQAAQVPGFAAWVTSLMPANVVKAAADGAMLPVIAFTLLFGLATRQIEASLKGSLLHFFGAVATAMTTIVDWVIWAAPVGIFSLVVVAASRAGIALAGAMAYYIIAISALLALFALLMYPIAAMVGRVPLGWFTRAAVPPQAVALSSSSSLASLPALVESARALGLPTSITGFVLPLSVSTFKVATPITWMMGILFLARAVRCRAADDGVDLGRGDSGGSQSDAAGRSARRAAAAHARADELRNPRRRRRFAPCRRYDSRLDGHDDERHRRSRGWYGGR